MTLSEQQERKIWDSWLDEEHGDKLVKIRTAVKEIYERNIKSYGSLPYYTPHGPEHCEAVENLIHQIIPGRRHEQLTYEEKFYLLSAAWLHDIGMLPYVVAALLDKNEQIPHEHLIRKRHHLISEEYVVKYWYELKVDESDKEILGQLCRYHRRSEDIEECRENFLVPGHKARLRLLAAYLRIADSLDIGPSRTPAEPYAVCLAYDIPDDAKLHWVKSRLVNGTFIDADNHTIEIQFRYPYLNIIHDKLILEKLNAIIRLVTEDLRDELRAVINVITRAGISYYLDIIPENALQIFESRMLNDIHELVINFDIMMAPSASRLMEIILVTFANIMGYSLIKHANPQEFRDVQKKNANDISKKITNLLNTVEERILSSRPCHLGLRRLIEELKEYSEEIVDDESLRSVKDKVNGLYQQHHEARHAIRDHSKTLFNKIISEHDHQKQISVILYGYSELATKAICGLRDYLIGKYHSQIDPKDIRNGPIESSISNMINIFICEGQPKTQTSYNDRLTYHDGSQYSLYLKERGFTNISIIPDIIAGTIIAKGEIDYIFLGTNGIRNDYFMHSAGHEAIVELARGHRIVNRSRNPLIILVTTKEKVISSKETPSDVRENVEELVEVEGCLFRNLPIYSHNRNNIWMCRDNQLLKTLRKAEVCFLNPREDRIPINKVDYIVSDIGYHKITRNNSSSVIVELSS